MGNYASTDELIARVGTQKAAELTSDSGSGPDATKLTAVIAAAEGDVDQYLSRRRATPVEVTGGTTKAAWLKALTLDLAVVRLWLLRDTVPPNIEEQRKLAIEALAKYAEAKTNMPGEPTGSPEFGYEERVTGRDKREGL